MVRITENIVDNFKHIEFIFVFVIDIEQMIHNGVFSYFLWTIVFRIRSSQVSGCSIDTIAQQALRSLCRIKFAFRVGFHLWFESRGEQ